MSLAIADNRLLPALLPPFSIAAGESSFTWTNALGVRVLIVVSGRIVTAISITRLGISTSLGLTSGSFILDPGDSITEPEVNPRLVDMPSLGLTSGSFILDPGDSITVTYTAAPSMVGIPV